MAALLDATLSRPLRHCLLRLAEALLLPAAARGDERAARAAAANADAFIAACGVQLAVDLVAGAPPVRSMFRFAWRIRASAPRARPPPTLTRSSPPAACSWPPTWSPVRCH